MGQWHRLADRPFGEDIRLTFQLALIVDVLQRAQQRVGSVVRKRHTVPAAVQKPVFRGVSVI